MKETTTCTTCKEHIAHCKCNQADKFRQDALTAAKRNLNMHHDYMLNITRWDLCQLIDLIIEQQATIDEQQGTITNRLDKIQGLKP